MCRFTSPFALIVAGARPFVFSGQAIAGEKTVKEKGAVNDKSAEKKFDFYAVPEGDVKELLQFLHRVQTFRATTVEELLAQRRRKTPAIKAAAEKILQLEKNTASKTAKNAIGILLGLRIEELANVAAGQQEPEQQQTVLKEVLRHLSGLDQLTSDELVLALKTASAVKQAGNAKLAAQVYDTFGKMFVDHPDKTLAGYGGEMMAAARQMKLAGQ